MEFASPLLEIIAAISVVYLVAFAWANRPVRNGDRCHICGRSHW